MSKWLMLVVVVLLVLTAAMGLRTISTQSFDGSIIASPSWTMAPTTAPPPSVPWGR